MPQPRQLFVRGLPGLAWRGLATIGGRSYPCALGRNGISATKREGDGATPLGTYRLVNIFYRADKVRRPRTALPVRAIRRDDGWCDEPRDRNYNRPVRHPYPASAERLWRDDELYDLVVVLSHNQRPRVRNRGSAVFLHVARPGFRPTEGCVAMRKTDLERILAVGPSRVAVARHRASISRRTGK